MTNPQWATSYVYLAASNLDLRLAKLAAAVPPELRYEVMELTNLAATLRKAAQEIAPAVGLDLSDE